MSVRDFVKHHYWHFNAAVVVGMPRKVISAHLARGGKNVPDDGRRDEHRGTLGLSLAEMIRQVQSARHLHDRCETSQEDIFNLAAHGLATTSACPTIGI